MYMCIHMSINPPNTARSCAVWVTGLATLGWKASADWCHRFRALFRQVGLEKGDGVMLTKSQGG